MYLYLAINFKQLRNVKIRSFYKTPTVIENIKSKFYFKDIGTMIVVLKCQNVSKSKEKRFVANHINTRISV